MNEIQGRGVRVVVMGTRVRIGIAAAVAGLVMAGLTVPAESQTPQPVSGSRVVVAAEFEPEGLHHWLVCCYIEWTRWIVDNLLPDAYAMAPDFTFVPEVLNGEAIVTADPFTITYTIKEEAVWNDGTPVSAQDFVFTWRSYKRSRNAVVSRAGYELITDAIVLGPKSVRFEFRRPFAEYKSLFSDLFPKHVLKDKNLNRAWRNQIPISAGPFQFEEWVRGSHLTLVRNENYWGDHLAYLDEVEFRFIQNVPKQVDALAAAEVDLIYPSLHPRLEDVWTLPDVEIQTSPGRFWEHALFQFKDGSARKPFVRRAVAHAIDRAAIVEQLIRPIDPEATVLDNLLLLVNEPGYEAHFDSYVYDPAQTQRILEDHGCTSGSDGIYRCGGRRLALRYVTTKPNAIRKRVAEMVHDDLAESGIEVEIVRGDPAVVFGRILTTGGFGLFNFAWVGSPPSFDHHVWSCGGSSNFSNYCNEDVGTLLREAEREIDPSRHAELINRADSVMADDVPALPLYQRPSLIAFAEWLEGVTENPTPEGPTWNLGEWWVRS